MSSEPTTNDFLDLIRQPLDEALNQLIREIRTIEAQQVSKGQTGAAIRSALDACKRQFDTNVLRTFAEADKIANSTALGRDDLRQLAVQALENFLNSIKGVMEHFKRHARGAAGALAQIDRETLALDQTLTLKARQFATGILNVPSRGTPISDERPFAAVTDPAQITSPHTGGGRIVIVVAGAGPSSQATLSGESTLSADATVIEAVATATTSGKPAIAPLRDRAEDAERLTLALGRSVAEEIDRLESERRNDPDTALAIGFLKMVAALLEEIANAIRDARQAHSPVKKEEKFERAETLVESLAQAAREYAENNYDRIINYGGNTLFVVLGTAMFAALFRVHPR